MMESRTKRALAGIGATVALTAGAVPAAAAAEVFIGPFAVQVPDVAPVPVPVPAGSEAAPLPALPYPLEWAYSAPPPPPAPKYVASNWIIMYTACPAPGEWAYTENGTRAWCAQRLQTDAFHWAPSQEPFRHPAATDASRMTRVENSLGGRPCETIGAKAINPSNGQEIYCDMEVRGPNPGPIWRFTDYLNFVTR